jgi:hypothetical protein
LAIIGIPTQELDKPSDCAASHGAGRALAAATFVARDSYLVVPDNEARYIEGDFGIAYFDTPIDHSMPGLYQIAVLLTVAVGSFTVGFSVASAANVIGLPGFLEYFGISLTGSNPSYSASMQGGTFRNMRPCSRLEC